MLDPKALAEMVEKQIADTVNDQVIEIFATNDWLQPIEKKIVKYTQDHIVSKFANASAVPDLIEVVKQSVDTLFAEGRIPGIEQYVDQTSIKQSIDTAVTNLIQASINELGRDTAWLEKVESLINQAVVMRTVAEIGSMDIASIINQRVDENVARWKVELLEKFASTGIKDQATSCQLTIMDETTVVENQLTARSIDAVDSLTVKDLVVKGSINTDNYSWDALADSISAKTLKQVDEQWRTDLVEQVKQSISSDGIAFDQVKLDDTYLVSGNELSNKITHTNIQQLGALKNLKVLGDSIINDTLVVHKNRIGINTDAPAAALSVWDEEVSIIAGKYKNQEAAIGTNRSQAFNILVNNQQQINIGVDGITTIKNLRVGVHRVGHATDVPGWSGTRGDIIFNSNPTPGSAFAWVCLGAFKWKPLKAVE